MIDNNNFYANNISGELESYNELDTAIANQALDKVCNLLDVVIFHTFLNATVFSSEEDEEGATV